MIIHSLFIIDVVFFGADLIYRVLKIEQQHTLLQSAWSFS